MITRAHINRALIVAGIDAELQEGRGYFYFTGRDVERMNTTAIMTTRLNALTVPEWVAEAQRMKDESTLKTPLFET